MQDQPSSSMLLQAVRDFIDEKAMPQLSGHTGFHARVARNVLDILLREQKLSPAFQKAEQKRLETLLGLGETGTLEILNQVLCQKIAAGEMNLSTPGLKTHLIKLTMGKLAIDQPRYVGYKKAQSLGWPEEDYPEEEWPE